MKNGFILEDVEKYVTDLFSVFKENNFSYHNLLHTQAVVDQARIIAENSLFSENEKKMLLIAAWFHDIGYLFTNTEHEEKSKVVARSFLTEKCIAKSEIEQIERCIDATKFPQNPKDKLSHAICDADFYHFARTDFFEISKNLMKEIQERTQKVMDEKMYWKITLELFEIHDYHTDYGKNVMRKGKMTNYQKLQNLVHG